MSLQAPKKKNSGFIIDIANNMMKDLKSFNYRLGC